MKRFFAALRFLTIFPVPASWAGDEDELAGSVPFFPVVGLLIGGVAAAAAMGASRVLPALPASVLIVVVLAAVSGALHLDGLADTADGLLSCRSRESAFEIMRDSRVGSMGVVAIVCILFMKVSALAMEDWGDELWRWALLMPVAGRCSLVLTMALFPYARPEGGLGAIFYRRRPVLSAVWALLVLGVTGWLVGGQVGLIAVGASMAVALLFGAYAYRKLGGATGDTLGATCEIAETVAALTLTGVVYTMAQYAFD